MSKYTEFANKNVANVFVHYPGSLKQQLLNLRELIMNTAKQTPGTGKIEETLKWGQPSYLTPETHSGTTIRIDRIKGSESEYALYVHCQTSLIETFKELYPDVFTFEGKRAILFNCNEALPTQELSHCISIALTYHLNKQSAYGL